MSDGLPMRLDALGLGNVMANDVKSLPSPKLSEATQQYIKLRGMGKAKTFHQTAIRNSNVVIEILGDKTSRNTQQLMLAKSEMHDCKG